MKSRFGQTFFSGIKDETCWDICRMLQKNERQLRAGTVKLKNAELVVRGARLLEGMIKMQIEWHVSRGENPEAMGTVPPERMRQLLKRLIHMTTKEIRNRRTKIAKGR